MLRNTLLIVLKEAKCLGVVLQPSSSQVTLWRHSCLSSVGEQRELHQGLGLLEPGREL